jgi:TRAP-type C4-dicarboxylate transport system permease small subunit
VSAGLQARSGAALRQIDRATEWIVGAARWLALPLALLLFLQWPLRDLLHAWSRQANDLAQCFFALYVALAVTEATRRGSHLAPRAFSEAWARRWSRALHGASILLGLLPWSLFVLASSGAQVWQSVMQFEGFPDSFNPGYFIVKLALWVFAGAVAVQALLDLRRLRSA